MQKILLIASFAILLGGCQALGDHYNCLAEVDRTVPAQTQQRYIRTDTKCIQSSEKTITGPFGANFGTVPSDKGDINCSAVPIYETIVLNQVQRDSAYQQCRNGVSSQRTQQNYAVQQQQAYKSPAPIPSPSNQKTPDEIRRYDQQRAKCDSIKDNDLFLSCMRQSGNSPSLKTKYSADSPYCRGTTDKNSPEYKSQCEQPLSNTPATTNAGLVSGNKLSGKPISTALSVQRYQETHDIYLYADACTISSVKTDYPQSAEIRNSSDGAFKFLSCYAVDKDGSFIFFSGGGFAATLRSSLFLPAKQLPTSPPQPKPVSPPNSKTSSMEQAKQKCIGLGFAAGTESFGQCVLKLSK